MRARRTPLLLAAATGALLLATFASAAAEPLALRHLDTSRRPGTITIAVKLNNAWTDAVFAPAAATRLNVLYDSNADSTADYVGRVVFRNKALVEEIAGHGNHYEAVPVSRPSSKSLKFTHPVDVLYSKVKPKRTLRLAIQLRTGGRVDRLPAKGWLVVPEPR